MNAASDTPQPEDPHTGHVHDDATTLERTLKLVGDRWSILIIRAALRGIRRFDDFADDLGIARP
ncbi:MAG: hypothetical protein LH616_02715, partial [Ilumatobacteraceae bacterium]|nr:hypothetical protein [Ilumatobacteraceae bacterium]